MPSDAEILAGVLARLKVENTTTAENAYIVCRELVAMADRGEIDTTTCYRMKLASYEGL